MSKGGKDSGDGGKGDYATGKVKLNKGDILYVHIGGQGRSTAKGSGGVWNGGVHAGPQGDSGAGGGGGYYGGQIRNGDVGAYGGLSYVGNSYNGNMIDGTKSMPNPNGGTMVVNTGRGYARIPYVGN